MNERAVTSFDPRIVLRPRALDETLDLALAYMRASPREFSRLFLLLTGPASAVLIGLSVALELRTTQRLCAAIILSPFLERVVTVYAGKHIFRNDPQIGAAIEGSLARLPLTFLSATMIAIPWVPMLVTNFDEPGWIGFAALLGSFWPLVLASWVYLGEVVHLEGLDLSRAMKRARVLIAFRFARALGLVIMSGIVRLLAAGGAELTTEFGLGFVLQFGDVSEAIGGYPAIVGYLFAGSYIALARMFDYVDARTRREGWDIQVRFHAIEQRARESEANRLAA